ncbi:MAG: hypothetical protein HRT47_13210 [Candidatus Caenarcaniphilales bacterium]|nr:hypothetical protein [Candidatus Caenarcaniphilales bacterium]
MEIIENIILTLGATFLFLLVLSFPGLVFFHEYKHKKAKGKLDPNKSFLENFFSA